MMVPDPMLVVRPGYGPGVGAGHLSRCLAVTQAWIDRRGAAVLVGDDDAPAEWLARFEEAGAARSATEPSIGDTPAVVLTDGYQLDSPTVHSEASAVIDDFGLSRPGPRSRASVIIDQNGGVPPGAYSLARRVLLGPRYCMLRAEFGAEPPRRGEASSPKLVVSMGGSPGSTPMVWASDVVRRVRGIEVTWLRGDIADVPAVLASSHVALSAAGSTTWELCRYGIPGVYVALEHNQELVLQRVTDLDVGLALGRLEDVPPADAASAIEELISDDAGRGLNGRRLVDGNGATRVATVLKACLLNPRPVAHSDCSLLYEWANDADTRRSARRVAAIAWDEHLDWFSRRFGMGSDAGPGFIIEYADVPVAQFRVDMRSPGVGEVAVSVGPDFRGRGLAAAVIDAGSSEAFRARSDLEVLVAEVKRENDRSRRAFLAADYDPMSSAASDGGRYLSYALRRPRPITA